MSLISIDRLRTADAIHGLLAGLDPAPPCDDLGEQLVKGRRTPVRAYRVDGTVSIPTGGAA